MAETTKAGGAAAPRWEPPNHAAHPRVAERGQEYTQTDARGVTRRIRADANGIVYPTSPEDVAIADEHGLAYAEDWTTPTFEGGGGPAEPTLADLTVPQLRERAGGLGLDLAKSAKKADLIEAVEAAEAAGAAEAEAAEAGEAGATGAEPGGEVEPNAGSGGETEPTDESAQGAGQED